MENIALIDNDLVVRKTHNFPNLALMKISAYHKSIGNKIKLIGFNEINPANLFNTEFDKIFISKAFTDSQTPEFITTLNNVEKGGTGFYFDLASNLPDKIEHSSPDYDLYNPILHTIKNKKYYTDYSIGFLTRGCFRHCSFCVNRNLNKVNLHSPIDEFYDNTKPKIALLDDNFLGLPLKTTVLILDKLKEINKPITFRQGLDIRLLTTKTATKLIELKYDGMMYFAFDMWKYRNEIEDKLKLLKKIYFDKKGESKFIQTKLYVFCGFDENNIYNDDFFKNDIEILFKRIEIILNYNCVPYVMRYEKSYNTPYEKIYLNIINWTNNIYMPISKQGLMEYLETYKMKYSIDFFKKHKRFWKYLNMKL